MYTNLVGLLVFVFEVISLKCPVQVFDSHDYVGCFVDTRNRLLPHYYQLYGTTHPDMENNRCLLYCKVQGYKYAGTENGEECYCGDDPYLYGPENIEDEYLLDYDCNKECIGDSEQICGGGWRLSVYETRLLPFEQHEQKQTRYMLVANNMILTAPATQVLTSRSEIECAWYCSIYVSCKVFVISKGDGQCSLYQRFEISCEGVQHIEGFHIYLMK